MGRKNITQKAVAGTWLNFARIVFTVVTGIYPFSYAVEK